jgi:hypothetical protein
MLYENSWPTPVIKTEFPEQVETVQAKILIATIDRLESEREDLVNTVSDLRQLLQRVAIQQEREATRRQGTNKAFEAEIDRLNKALIISEKHSSHFSAMADFWQEI